MWNQHIISISATVNYDLNRSVEFLVDYIFTVREPLCVHRLHNASHCYQSGYVQRGLTVWEATHSGRCPPGGRPAPRAWFTAAVLVRAHRAWAYVDHVLVTSLEPRHVTVGRAGVVTFTGINNTVYFRLPRLRRRDSRYGKNGGVFGLAWYSLEHWHNVNGKWLSFFTRANLKILTPQNVKRFYLLF